MENLSLNDESINSKNGIQIIRPVDHSFELQFNALSKILSDDSIQDHQLVVVSIAGAFRKGKSFLMNFFLKYLYAQYKKHDLSNWIAGNGDGFRWRGGQKPETVGIWMWPEIFTHEFSNDDKVAIILLDTQGIFDDESSVKDCIATFAISMLLSSVQCFNVMSQVQEDDLQHLNMFTKYAQLAMEHKDEKPFQELLFLVRDWPYSEENDYGYSPEYAEKILMEKSQQTSEMRDLRQGIRSSFNKINAYLMAHPGLRVHQGKQLNGQISDIESDFIQCVEKLAPSLFAPDKLIVKQINGQKWGPLDFISFLVAYIEIFNGDELPKPESILTATMKATLLTLQIDCLKMYDDSINECVERKLQNRSQPYFNDNELQSIHDKVKHESMLKFQKKNKLGGNEMPIVKDMQLELENDIEECFKSFKQSNDNTKNTFNALMKADLEMVYLTCSNGYASAMDDGFNRIESYFDDKDLQTLHKRAKQASLGMIVAEKHGANATVNEFKLKLIIEIDKKFENFKKLNEKKKANHSSVSPWVHVAAATAGALVPFAFGGVGGILPFLMRFFRR